MCVCVFAKLFHTQGIKWKKRNRNKKYHPEYIETFSTLAKREATNNFSQQKCVFVVVRMKEFRWNGRYSLLCQSYAHYTHMYSSLALAKQLNRFPSTDDYDDGHGSTNQLCKECTKKDLQEILKRKKNTNTVHRITEWFFFSFIEENLFYGKNGLPSCTQYVLSCGPCA